MAFVDIAISVGLYLWELFKLWLWTLFVAPFKNFDMLWVLIPIWLTWVFAEFFQEKAGTSLGNAISNAVTPFWASLDWTRSSIRFFEAGVITTGSLVSRIIIGILVFGYGIAIIVLGIKAKQIVRYIGRIREVTYLVAMFTPVIYNVVDISFKFVLSMIIFFPLFYFTIELIDYLTPEPEAMKVDEGGEGKKSKKSEEFGDFGSSSGSMGDLESLDSPSTGFGGSGTPPSSSGSGSFGGLPPDKGLGGFGKI